VANGLTPTACANSNTKNTKMHRLLESLQVVIDCRGDLSVDTRIHCTSVDGDAKGHHSTTISLERLGFFFFFLSNLFLLVFLSNSHSSGACSEGPFPRTLVALRRLASAVGTRAMMKTARQRAVVAKAVFILVFDFGSD
jgi:hypothetical protein